MESQLRPASRKCHGSCIIENRCYAVDESLDDTVTTVNYSISDKYLNTYSWLDFSRERCIAGSIQPKKRKYMPSDNPIART